MRKNILLKIIFVLIFLAAFLAMVFASKADSVTTDEGIHLFAGYTYLTQRDFRLDPEHPPLLKEMAAVPLLFIKNLRVPLDGLYDKAANFYYDSWQEARILGASFLFGQGNDADKLIFWGRFPFIILTLFLGLAVYFWSKKLYGEKAGLLAAFLILFLPNILSHGHLINTDLGLTLFLFLSVYFYVQLLKKFSWINFFLSGLFLGFVFASKFTSLMVIPILLILLIIKLILFKNNFKSILRNLAGFLGIILLGFIMVWATYGFSIEIPPKPLGSLSNNINLWTNFNVPASFDNVFSEFRPVMFPADYYKGIFLVGRHALGGHGAFLLGQTSNTGWWYYFPVAIFYKTPIPFLIFLLLSIVFWKKLKTKSTFDELAIIAVPVLFLLMSMFSKADLGIRHVLPIFPFLAVIASRSIKLFDFKKIYFVGIFSILIIWYLISNIISFPNYLAYFNEFAGGSKNNYKILTDSNLDWGQDIFRVKKYLDQNHITDGYILYPWNGDEALSYYGVNFKPLPWEGGENLFGHAIVSATYYQLAQLNWLDKYPREFITPGVLIFKLD